MKTLKSFDNNKWNGNGNPPVGAVCRYYYTRSRTNCSGVCEILGYDNDQVLFKPQCAKRVTMRLSDVTFSAV